MKLKTRYWCLLAIISIALGSFITITRLDWTVIFSPDPSDRRGLLLWFSIFTAGSFVALLLSILFFKLSRIFFRWFFTWRILKRAILAAAVLALLILAFYTEENWRGHHAWETYKRDWEAKGEKFDFASFIPPPVPDDQNFALTPIVASCYSDRFDKNGHLLNPIHTNVVNRLKISIYHYHEYANYVTNSDWERGQITDLKAWSAYYRCPPPKKLPGLAHSDQRI